MKRNIIIDLDGTFIDTHKAIQKYVNLSYPDFNMENVHTYDFNKSLKDLPELNNYFDKETIKDILNNNFDTSLKAPRSFILKSLSDESIFKESKPFDKAVENVRELMNNERFYTVFNSTAYSSKIASVKYQQLIELYPEEKYTISVSIGEKPLYYNSPIVIEDSLDELKRYFEANIKGDYYLIDKPYNQEIFNPNYNKLFKNIKRVKDINEAILNIVL